MSNVIGLEERAKTDWLRSPATLAEHLSHGSWVRYDHLDYISERIREIEDRPLRLIVTIPPRFGKSELISHWTPVWFLKKYPYKKVGLASYQSQFATEWGGKAKNSIETNKQELQIELMQDTHAKAHWRIKGYGGEMYSTGVGGALTGRGFDLILVDDPIKSQKEALSEVYRNSTWEWYRATLRTRLQSGGSIIILLTRWHDDDLVGRLLGEMGQHSPFQDDWEVINLPALAEANDTLNRKVGEPLCPEMFTLDELYTLREALGSFWWSAEFQGSPKPEGGGIIKEAWFAYYDDNPFEREKEKVKRCIQVWDTAYEQKKISDRSASITMVETDHFYDIVDVSAGRPTFPELCRDLKSKYSQYIPDRIWVEAKASGKSLVQQIRADTKLPVLEIVDSEDKSARLHSISGIVETGKVRLKARAPWLSEFLKEVCGFPTAEHDDITDCFSYALRKLKPALRDVGGLRRGKKKAIYEGGMDEG